MYFLYHNLILFSQENYKKQTQMFYQNHSLALHAVEIFCNLILKSLYEKEEILSLRIYLFRETA